MCSGRRTRSWDAFPFNKGGSICTPVALFSSSVTLRLVTAYVALPQDAALLAELEQLRAQVRDQAQEIEELTSQITTLRERLDVERRYLSDITPRHFKGWLKKQPTSPLVTQMFADPLFPPRGPRSLYEAHIRAHYGPVERDDFVWLWKLMLLQS